MECRCAEAQSVTLYDGCVDRRALRRFHPQPNSLIVDVIVEPLVVPVHVNRRSSGLLELGRPPDVIDMGVRDYDGFYLKSVALEDSKDARNVVTRIDHDGVMGSLV